jgi:hypothetical protein
MVPLAMVVSDELGESAEEATLPEEDQPVEALLSDRAHEALGVRRWHSAPG